MSIEPVVLYEWVDENGEVEDFILFDLRKGARTHDFFDFSDALMSIHFDDYAEALREDWAKWD